MMSGKSIVWLHGDSLSSQDPALQANPSAPAIFVFDEPFLAEAALSFKRLQFLFESASEALAGREGEIHRGHVVAEILAFASAHQAETVHVTASVAPRFRQLSDELREHLPLIIHEPEPFVVWRGKTPKRFSAFWRTIEEEALRPNGRGPHELEESE